MARIRTLASGIAAWIVLATTVSAAPVSWFDSQAALTAWYANQLNSSGSVFSAGSANALTNLPSNLSATTTAPAATAAPKQSISASQVAPVVGVAPTPPASALGAVAPRSAAPSYQADAFINLGSGPYAESSITTGNARPWHQSPSAAAVYGGVPTAEQQADFGRDILSRVQQTFALSGVDIKLTTDPGVSAAHTMSVVSGASYAENPSAIGITQVGDSGFSFIDKLNYASNPDQLAWAVAHNVAHELMHALGVAAHPDAGGGYIDAAAADWNLLTDPNTKFSPAAVSMIKAAMANGAGARGLGAEILKSGVFSAHVHEAGTLAGDQVLATPVPEPATVAVWALGLVGGLALRRRARRAA